VKLLADMTPRQLVSCIDFRYITDAMTADEAIDLLERHAGAKAESRGGAAKARLSRLHHLGRLGWIQPTKVCARCAARRWLRDGRTSK